MTQPSLWQRVRPFAFFALVALAVCIHIRLYSSANPVAALNLRVTSKQAQRLAADFLAAQGQTPPKGYQSVVTFETDDAAKEYLERTLGLARANRVAQRDGFVFSWHVRWFRLGAQDEYHVSVAPDGRILTFYLDTPNDAPSAASHAPQAVATAFLRQMLGPEAAHYRLKGNEVDPYSQRTDYGYRWERENSRLGKAVQCVKILVSGDRVTVFHRYLRVPEAAQHQFAKGAQKGALLANIAFACFIPIIIAGIIAIFTGLSRHTLSWQRMALPAGVVAVVTLLTTLNTLPLSLADLATTESLAGFLTDSGVSMLAGVAGAFFSLLLLVVAAEWLYRRAFPTHRPLRDWFTLNGIQSRGGRARLWLGYGMIALHLGYATLFYFVAEHLLHGWSPADVRYSDLLSTMAPWTVALEVGASAAVMEEFLFRVLAISWLKRWLKRDWLAILIPAMIWAFAHCNYPNQPFYIRGIELTIWGCVFGLIFVRFGPLPTLIAHAGFNALLTGEWFLAGATWATRSNFVIVGLCLLIPLALAYWPRRRANDTAPITNAELDAELTEAAKHREPLMPLPDTEPAFPRIPRRAWITGGVLVAIGLVLGGIWSAKTDDPAMPGWVESGISPTKAHFITRSQAITHARAAIAAQGGTVGQWKLGVALDENSLDEQAGGYLDQYLTGDDVDTLAQRVMTPPQLWRVHWQQPLGRESWTVRLLPDGTVWDVFREIPEEAPAPRLTEAAARTTAEAELRRLGIDLSHLKLTGANARALPRRTRYTFTWEITGLKIGQAQCITEVAVDAGRVNSIERWIALPESYQFAKDKDTPLYAVATILGLLLTSVLVALTVVNRTRGYRPPWVWGARIAAVVMIPGIGLAVLNVGRGWEGLNGTTSPAMHAIGLTVGSLAALALAAAVGVIMAALFTAQWAAPFSDRPGPRTWLRACARPWRYAPAWRQAILGLFILLAIAFCLAGVSAMTDLLPGAQTTGHATATLPSWLANLPPYPAVSAPFGQPELMINLTAWWPPLFALLASLLGGALALFFVTPLAGMAKQTFRRPVWAMLWLSGTVIIPIFGMPDTWQNRVTSGIEALLGMAGLWLAWKLVFRWNPLTLAVAVTASLLATFASNLAWFPAYRPFSYAVGLGLAVLVLWALWPRRARKTIIYPPRNVEHTLRVHRVEDAQEPVIEAEGTSPTVTPSADAEGDERPCVVE